MGIRTSWGAIDFYRKPISGKPMGKSVRQQVVLGKEPIFRLKGKEWSATGRMVEGGFIIYKGSTVNAICPSFAKDKMYYPIRHKCEEDGIIKNGTFIKDFIFRGPCQAGSAIACRYINTNREWKTADEDAMTWGECHPKLYGESKTYTSSKPKRKVAEKVVLGWSERDGSKIYTKIIGNKIVEFRGNICMAFM